jgi:hypothetical protein
VKANPNPSLNDLNVLNKIAGNVARSGKGNSDTALGSPVRDAFSDYVTGLGQGDLASGSRPCQGAAAVGVFRRGKLTSIWSGPLGADNRARDNILPLTAVGAIVSP